MDRGQKAQSPSPLESFEAGADNPTNDGEHRDRPIRGRPYLCLRLEVRTRDVRDEPPAPNWPEISIGSPSPPSPPRSSIWNRKVFRDAIVQARARRGSGLPSG